MTNGPWVLDPKTITKTLGIQSVSILNDMTAAALGLLRLGTDDARQIGGSTAIAHAPKAIIAPGTGLGISGLIPAGDVNWSALPSEGGHVDLAPQSEREIAVIFHLLRQHGHVSAERILSGPGLETLYQTLAALDGIELKAHLAAVDIVNAAKRGEAMANEAINLFCGWLGSVAGNLTLSLGAQGGLYIGGGIVSQWGDLFDEALFRRRFEAKGRASAYLEPIPTYLITRKDTALLGCLEKAQSLIA